MAIAVSCPQCGRAYRVADSSAGKSVRCSDCGARIVVPGERAPVATSPAAATRTANPSSASRPTPPPPPAEPENPWDDLAALGHGEPAVGVAPPALPSPAAVRPAPVQPSREAAAAAAVASSAARKRSAGIRAAEAAGWVDHYAFTIGGCLVLLCLVLAGLGSMTASKPLLIALFIVAVLGGSVNAIWSLSLVWRDSPVSVFLMFIPIIGGFYSLYYFLTRFDPMWRPMVIGFGFAGAMFLALPGAHAIEEAEKQARGGGSAPAAAMYTDADGIPRLEASRSISGGGDSAGSGGYGRQSPPSFANNPSAPAPSDEFAARRARETARREQERAFLQRVEAFCNRDPAGMSREQAMEEFRTFRDGVKAERAAATEAGGDVRVIGGPSVDAMLSRYESRLGSLPSREVGDWVFKPLTAADGQSWARAAQPPVTEEAGLGSIRFRPPAGSQLDLSQSHNEKVLVFRNPKSGAAVLTVRVEDKRNPRQERLYTMQWPNVQQTAAQAQDLLTVDLTQERHTVGTVGDLQINCVEPKATAGAGIAKYVLPLKGQWVIFEAAEVRGTPAPFAVSIRKAKPGEPAVDSFAPAKVAALLPEQTDAAMAALRPHGAAAERYVLPHLKSDKPELARAAAKFLSEFGTAACVADLKAVSTSTDAELANAARAGLRRIAPTEFDAMAELMLDLKGTDQTRKTAAVEKLAATPPDEKQRAAVATLLEDMVLADASPVDRAAVGRALSAWHGARTVVRLSPILADQNVAADKRDAAMDVLTATKNPAAVGPVLKWLGKEPEKTQAALLKFGAVSESAVAAAYTEFARNADDGSRQIRARLVRILGEVGETQKSLAVLIRASTDPRDKENQAVAKQAMEDVKARIGAKKG